MPITEIAIGWAEEAYHRSALAKFISALIFNFAGEGSGMAFSKLTDGASTTPSPSLSPPTSPADTSTPQSPSAATYITLLWGILYWIAQCLGSTVACLLLKFCTGGMLHMFRRWRCKIQNIVIWLKYQQIALMQGNLKGKRVVVEQYVDLQMPQLLQRM